MKNTLAILWIIICISACNKREFFDGPNFFEDGFEEYTILDDLLIDDDTYWSFTQQTREENVIRIDTLRAHSGSKSLRFEASKTTNGNASKCSIAKQNMAFWEGEILRVSGWYFIEGEQSLDWLFLMDMEEQVVIGAGPGMRIALVENQLLVEHKFYEPNIKQEEGTSVEFPRNEWVEIVWEVLLSTEHEGYVKLWQNGVLIIDAQNERTLPKDFLYSQQGTKGMYSSVEVGITANSADNDLEMWIDDVKFEKVD